jgi:hypothetical protein
LQGGRRGAVKFGEGQEGVYKKVKERVLSILSNFSNLDKGIQIFSFYPFWSFFPSNSAPNPLSFSIHLLNLSSISPKLPLKTSPGIFPLSPGPSLLGPFCERESFGGS